MGAELGRLFSQTLRVVTTEPLLWLAVVAGSLLPTLPRGSVGFLLTCALLIGHFVLTSYSLLAIPFIVLSSTIREHITLPDTWRAFRQELPRLLLLAIVLFLPAACLALPFAYLVQRSQWASFALLSSYALLVLAFPFLSLTLAGIVIDRLNPLRALSNALAVGVSSIGLLVVVSLLLSLLSLLLQSVLWAFHLSPSFIATVFSPSQLLSPSPSPVSQLLAAHLAQTIVYLPLGVFQAATWVVFYIRAMERRPYALADQLPAA